jgi:hypothetical protein
MQQLESLVEIGHATTFAGASSDPQKAEENPNFHKVFPSANGCAAVSASARTMPVVNESINGSARAPDGTFWMLPQRQFPTDGRAPRSIDRLLDLVHRYEKLLPYAANPSIEVALRAVRESRKHLDEIEYEAVAVARGFRWSWRTIAETLGISATTAHKRFARPRELRSVPARKWTWDDLSDEGFEFGE